MKKAELIESIFEKSNLSKSDSKDLVNTVIDEIKTSVISGEGIEIRGFGSFLRRYRKKRLGINPKTSEKTQVGAKYVPFFRLGKRIKKRLNKN